MKKFLYYNIYIKEKKWREINNNYHYCITIYKKKFKTYIIMTRVHACI